MRAGDKVLQLRFRKDSVVSYHPQRQRRRRCDTFGWGDPFLADSHLPTSWRQFQYQRVFQSHHRSVTRVKTSGTRARSDFRVTLEQSAISESVGLWLVKQDFEGQCRFVRYDIYTLARGPA